MDDPQPAIPLDNLPRPGVAISRARWLDLIAAEAENAKLRDPEAIIKACVPGGQICDPQQVADAIRAYFNQR